MFMEYKNHRGIDVSILSKVLIENRGRDCAAIVFETPDLATSVAVVEFDLILAFKFLTDAMADHGVAIDAYLARRLNELDPSFKTAVMEQFVNFRRANGIELNEDATFEKTKDIGINEIEDPDL